MFNEAIDQKATAWLAENREKILNNWMELIRIPSVKGEAQPNAPYGAECARALKTAARQMEAVGAQVKIHEEGGYALAAVGCGEKTIGLFGHSDVVPVGDDWQFTQPFDPVIQNGMLIGRGASDNKSGVMASQCILAMIRQLQIPVKSRVQAFVGSNEESGMGDMEAFVKNEAMPTLSLVPDSQFPCGMGEKGILRMWARCCRPLEAVREVKGGNAFNIVLDRVDAVVAYSEALEKELARKCGDGCSFRVEADGIHITAEGVAKHAAYPDGGVNAVWVMAKLLAGCEALPEGDRVAFGTLEAFLCSHWGEGLGIAHEDSHFGRLTAVSGMVATEDGRLKVSLDCRYGTECDPATLERRLQTAWGEAGWEITYLENRPGYLVDENSALPGTFVEIFRQMSGHDRGCYFMAGGTYGRYLKNAFVVGSYAIHADREGPGMVMPAGRGGAHQRDEAIDVEGFFLAVRILLQYVLACDKLLNP